MANKIELPKDKIIKLYEGGMPIDMIAQEVYVSRQTIWARLKEWGYNTSKKRFKAFIGVSPKEIETMYWKKKMSMDSIGEYYGTSAMTVYNFMKYHGIRRREIGNSNRPAITDKEKLKSYIEKGFSINEIAYKYGVCSNTIKNYINKWDLKSPTPKASLIKKSGLKHNKPLTKADLINKITAKTKMNLGSLWASDIYELEKLERSVRG